MFSIKYWVDDPNPKRPLLLIIPGFLNEKDIQQPLSGWYEQTLRFAHENAFSAAGLYWNSRGLTNNRVTSLNPYRLSKGLLATWRDAAKEADRIVMPLRRALKEIDRPIILVGHSLGGRIALKVGERFPKGKIQSIVTLAAAYESSVCKYDKIQSSVQNKVIVCHSQRDMVLQSLFTLGQSSRSVLKGLKAFQTKDKWSMLGALSEIATHRVTNPAIGLYGIPSSHMSDKFIVQDCNPLGHLDYCKELCAILSQHKEDL